MSNRMHPLLGLWLVQSPDEEGQGEAQPLVGRSDTDLLVLAFRDLPRARQCATKLEVQKPEFRLVCDANLGVYDQKLRDLGVVGVAVDWAPGQASLDETRSFGDYAAA
jgi:hypothetical protein